MASPLPRTAVRSLSAVALGVVLTVGTMPAAHATETAPAPAPVARTTRADAAPLLHAHAHNDYLHARPLQDALDHGFTSVEADVWLTDGKLCLGHGWADCSKDLEKNYLKPLADRAAARGGSVYAGWDGTFQLLIELKSGGEQTWPAVEKALAKYPALITHWKDGRRTDGPVQAVITGNRPKATMLAARERWSALDGDLSDIGRYSADFMPMVSASWWDEFSWRGFFGMPVDERRKLQGLVAAAHKGGHTIRFYATPELDDPASAARRRNVWAEERKAGVDWLNTDNLAALEDFLR